MNCQCLAGCPFFNDKMKNMPAMAEHMKKKYCRADWENCARYMVFRVKGKPSVPADLFPAQKARAATILGD